MADDKMELLLGKLDTIARALMNLEGRMTRLEARLADKTLNNFGDVYCAKYSGVALEDYLTEREEEWDND